MTNEEAINVLHRMRHYANAFTDVSEALRIAISALERDRWISVEDDLPFIHDDGYSSDVYVTDGTDITKSQLFRSWDGITDWGYTGIGKITHWRYTIPLPEPPKEGKP